MELYEKKLSSRQLFAGKVIRVELDEVELPNGKITSREVVRHHGGVCILALDEDGNVPMVKQYRYPYAEVLMELPAGKLEPGEDPADCGRRELEEETGYVAGEFSLLGKVYPTPGYVDEVLHLYLAKRLDKTAQRLDDDEFLNVEWLPLSDVIDRCLDGTIVDAKTVVAVLKYNELCRRA